MIAPKLFKLRYEISMSSADRYVQGAPIYVADEIERAVRKFVEGCNRKPSFMLVHGKMLQFLEIRLPGLITNERERHGSPVTRFMGIRTWAISNPPNPFEPDLSPYTIELVNQNIVLDRLFPTAVAENPAIPASVADLSKSDV